MSYAGSVFGVVLATTRNGDRLRASLRNEADAKRGCCAGCDEVPPAASNNVSFVGGEGKGANEDDCDDIGEMDAMTHALVLSRWNCCLGVVNLPDENRSLALIDGSTPT